MNQEEIRATENARANSSRQLLIGAGLLVAVVVVLAGAWLLNARFRSEANVMPNPTSAKSISAVSPSATATMTGGITSPTPERSVTGSPTSVLSVEQAVEQAYLRYWEVYSDALYTLDTSQLGDVMAGTELDLAIEHIEQLQSQNQAAKTDVEHDFVVVDIDQTTAAIEDHYLNKSVLVDATTKQPLQAPGDGEVEAIACRLELIDGTWKVVEVVQVNR